MKNDFERKFFFELLDKEIQQVEEKIFRKTKVESGFAREASEHLVSSGGKRIRATLAILCGKLLHSKAMDRNLELASAVEILHTATLLHDDIIDDAKLRRGKLATHVTWGDKTAILLGDLFLSRALDIITSLNNQEILSAFTDVMEDIILGEFAQFSLRGKVKITQKEYFDIITNKTAKFFATTCLASAVLSGASKTEITSLYNYGLNLGIIFQLVDDLFDYMSDEDSTGKPIGSDLKEGKVTLPLILAYEKADEKEKTAIEKIVANIFTTKEMTDSDKLLAIISKYGIDGTYKEIIQQYAYNAKKAIDIFSGRELVQDFLNLVDFCVIRRY